MKSGGQALAARETGLRFQLGVLAELVKLRLTLLVLLTTVVGFYLATQGKMDAGLLMQALLGTALVASGAAALNQYLEKDQDARMLRTAGRPIPAGHIRPEMALLFGGAMAVIGLVYLAWTVNLLTSVLGAVTLVSYVLVYTPLKRVTTLNTAIGSIPGALPPLMGWTAAGGAHAGISPEGVVLVVILIFWQLPHFLAISWICRAEYERAEFVMLAVEDKTGLRTGRHAVGHVLVLILVSALPFVMNLAGSLYLAGALALGVFYLVHALRFARKRTVVAARQLFYGSILYLPLLLGLLMYDKIR